MHETKINRLCLLLIYYSSKGGFIVIDLKEIIFKHFFDTLIRKIFNSNFRFHIFIKCKFHISIRYKSGHRIIDRIIQNNVKLSIFLGIFL